MKTDRPPPEGPEVKRFTSQLDGAARGWHVYSVTWENERGRYRDSNPDGADQFLTDIAMTKKSQRVVEIGCKGKFIYWRFERDEWSMWNTLGMTGHWSDEPDDYESICVHLTNDDMSRMMHLSFNDIRHFGTVKFVKGKKFLDKKLASLGFDPLSKPPSDQEMFELLKAMPNKQIAQLLMDQKRFAGVGNYIKSESLYLAGISPKRLCRDIKKKEALRLRDAITKVMTESYRSGGATIATYKDFYGNVGAYSSRFMVYGKKTDPRGNAVISENTADKRTSWYVPAIQV